MNRFEKRRLKRKIYRHINAILYSCIFIVASIITIIAVYSRNGDISYVDESQLSATVTEAIGIDNDESAMVAASDQNQPETLTETTEVQTGITTSKKVKVIADTLLVRNEKSQDSETLGSLDEDDVVDVVAEYDGWIEINFGGETGYISAEFVEPIEQ